MIDRDGNAAPDANPDDASRLERHGTQLAGIVAGSEGPAELAGVAPRAGILPIRVAGWQQNARGTWGSSAAPTSWSPGSSAPSTLTGTAAPMTPRGSRSSASASLFRLRRQPGRARNGRCPAPGHARRRSRRERRARRPRVRQHRRPGWISERAHRRGRRHAGQHAERARRPPERPRACVRPACPARRRGRSTAQPLAAGGYASLQPQAEVRGEALELKDFFDEAGLSLVAGRAAPFPQARIPGSQPRKR